MLTASLGPDDLVFPNSITVVITTDPDQPAQGGAAVTVHATASAPVFSMAAVAHLIASEGGSTDMGPLVVSNLSDLNPSVAPSKTPQNMTLSLSGTATLVGSYDKATLIKSLAGKNRKDIGSQLGAYPGIADMKISVYPFWSTTLPSDPAKISITEVRHAAP
jgi:hypothetical protein